jgi:hypothetical protein
MNYINERQLNDEYEHLRILNLFNDDLASKKVHSYESVIDDTARDLPSVPGYGAYVVAIYGVENTLPCGIFAVCKSDQTASGNISTLVSQVGTSAWAGNALALSSTATAIQISHDRAGESAKFNVSILGVL